MPTVSAYAIGLIGLLVSTFASPVKTDHTCLRFEAGKRSLLHPVAAGTDLRLIFVHSIYGTEVQEQLWITPTGFQTAKLRYAELRTAEFYGHDGAKLEHGWWVVNNPGRYLPHLDIRASEESAFRISFGEQEIRLGNHHAMDGPVRILVTSCGDH
jgi:Domain of unknown function (DUF1850)